MPWANLPSREMFVSAGVHILLIVATIAIGSLKADHAPMIDPNDVMMVHAVALPKQTKRVPDKPMRTPDPPQGETQATKPPPPPTASEMALEKPDAPKTEGTPKPQDHTQDRQKLLAKTLKDNLLKDLTAQVGNENRTATDPDGVDPDKAILGPGITGKIDPELAKFQAACRAAILPHWTPLPTTLQEHPEYAVVIEVKVASDGSLGTPKVLKGTGDSSFDRSAVMAVIKTGKLPPPPEKYRDSAASGIRFTLSAADL